MPEKKQATGTLPQTTQGKLTRFLETPSHLIIIIIIIIIIIHL